MHLRGGNLALCPLDLNHAVRAVAGRVSLPAGTCLRYRSCMKTPDGPRSRNSKNPLALLLGSPARAAGVIYFVLHPNSALDFRALGRVSGASSRSLHREMVRLEELGLVQRENAGPTLRFRALGIDPRWSALREVVREFTAPEHLMRIMLTHLDGVEAAFIFGSCARGDMHRDSDIDVFIIGDTQEMEDRLEYAGARLEACMVLRREVNPVHYTRGKLEARRGGSFLTSVLAGQKIWLIGNEELLRPDYRE
jgi:predicted nucleotidyltransferase